MNNLENIKALFLDLDGTIYIGNKPIGDIVNTLNYIRNKNIKIVFITNNSSQTKEEYIKKLKKLNLYNKKDIFYSSLMATADYIKEKLPNSSIYPIATQKVIKFFKKRGIITSENADIVVLTFDTSINYKKIKRANELLLKGRYYISTHPDIVCPSSKYSLPDVGSFIELFKASSGRKPDIIVGKPNINITNYLLKQLNISSVSILMVGDRLYTDILFGINSNIKTALVLTGETTYKMAKSSKIKPTFILDNINEIINYL